MDSVRSVISAQYQKLKEASIQPNLRKSSGVKMARSKAADVALTNKAKQTGIPKRFQSQVYNRGMADADIAKKVRKAKAKK